MYELRKTIKASEFKARCLKLMDLVADGSLEYVITKNGKPLARLVAYDGDEQWQSSYGAGRGRARILGDIVSPMEDAPWDAQQGKLLSTEPPMKDDAAA